MLKKNLSILFIILLSLLLIAMVIWMYEKRIETIEVKMHKNYLQFSEKLPMKFCSQTLYPLKNVL